MRRREFILGLVAAGVVREPEHFDVVRVSKSVFAVRGKANSSIPTNSAVIVGENGVAVVDGHMMPSLDREVIGIVKRLTSQPIRYLINTHWHQDHTLGNQAFEDFAVILGHEATKTDLIKRVVPNLALQRETLPGQQTDDDAYLKELPTIRVTPPTRVFRDSYKLDISDNPIELRHFGFGHTHGDIIIHLPHEETIILGDLVTAGQPFMRRNDAVPSAWGTTLRKIAALPWNRAVIGHGWVENPRDRLNIFADFLDTLVREVSLVSHLPLDRIPAAVIPRLKSFAPHFPYFDQAIIENIHRTHDDLVR